MRKVEWYAFPTAFLGSVFSPAAKPAFARGLNREREMNRSRTSTTPAARVKGATPMPPCDTRNILVIGDVHVGSMYGLLPPDFVSCDGAEKPQNEGQKYLW